MKKLLLLFFALLTGIGGAWAEEVTVTVTTTAIDPATNGSFSTSASTTGYYTTWTSNAASGLEGLTINTGGSLGMKSQNVNTTTYGTVLALKTSSTSTAEDLTITAPTGYYIKGYSIETKRYSSDKDNYTITTTGGKELTSIGTSTSTSWSESAPYSSTITLKVTDTTENGSANYLCIVALTITLTTELPGTQLNATATGVAWSAGANSWNNNWTSGTTPSIRLQAGNSIATSNVANFKAGKTEGSFILHSVSSPYYTLTVPFTHIIKSYTIVGVSTGAVTFTQSEGTVTSERSSFAAQYTNSVTVSDLNKNSVSFQLTGGSSSQIDNAQIYVEYVPAYSLGISDLSDISNEKVYLITNARATWTFADNASQMGVSNTSTDMANAAQQVAIVQRDSKYYLFSVNAQKYLTADNTLTNLPSDAEEVTITKTDNANYPWFFQFANVTNKIINIGSTPNVAIDNWGSASWGAKDEGNQNAILPAGSYDLSTALAMFNVRTPTYKLVYGGETVATQENVTTSVGTPASEFVPASFLNDFVTLTYEPETITNETTEVTVTATWAGPFLLSESFAEAKWYVVGMHTYYESDNHVWKNVDGLLATEQVATDAYHALTDAHCFAFTGSPYTGIHIWNKAAGASAFVNKVDDQNTQATIGATATDFIPKASTSNTNTAIYACFLPSGGSNYLNCYADNSYRVYGWGDRSEGSTCWFLPAGQYYLNYIDGLNLDAPVGAVGTSVVFTNGNTGATKKGNIVSYRSTIASAPTSSVSAFTVVKDALDEVREAATITLTEGYYRIVNAQPRFEQDMALYYNSTTEKIAWAREKASNAVVDNIFKFAAADSKWSLYSPNAGKYLTANDGTLSETATSSATLTNLGSAQWNINLAASGSPLHPSGHNTGSATVGTSGTLTSWAGGVGEPSAWYIVKVDGVALTLNGSIAGKYYATLCLPFEVTISGADAYTLDLNNAKTGLTLSEALTTVPAGTPVLLCGESATATANIAANAATGGLNGETALTGTFTDLAVTADTDYFLGADGSDVGFYKWDGTTLKANRAYLSASAVTTEVKGFAINFDDADAISDIFRTQDANGVYNMSGQRVGNPTHGLYIVNGKKVFIK